MQRALSVDMRDGHGRARVTVAGQGVLADLAETGRWLDSHEGRLELVRLTPPPTWGSQPQDSSLAPLTVLRP